MKAAIVNEYGAADVFKIEDRPEPELKPGHLLVRARASGVNFADIMARNGLYPDAPKLPMLLGYEIAGEIEKIGDGVRGFAVGQRVYAMTMFGGYAEKVAVPALSARLVPDGMSFEQAAAVPVNYITAWHSLTYMAGLRPGETVLVHSAAGGVGTAAIQIAKHIGAKIIGTASAKKHAYAKALGADETIDYREKDFVEETMRITGGKGVDVALDSLGGPMFMKSYRCLAQAGRLVTFGMFSIMKGGRDESVEAMKDAIKSGRIHPLQLFNDNKAVIGVNVNHLAARQDIISREMDDIDKLLRAGVLAPKIDSTFPLEQVADAHRRMEDRLNEGKVILTA